MWKLFKFFIISKFDYSSTLIFLFQRSKFDYSSLKKFRESPWKACLNIKVRDMNISEQYSGSFHFWSVSVALSHCFVTIPSHTLPKPFFKAHGPCGLVLDRTADERHGRFGTERWRKRFKNEGNTVSAFTNVCLMPFKLRFFFILDVAKNKNTLSKYIDYLKTETILSSPFWENQ